MSGCNKHINADVIDPSNDIPYCKLVFIIFTTLNSPSRGTPEILITTDSVFQWGHTPQTPGLLHNYSLFMIYLTAVSLTLAPLGL